ncbi:DUF1450 domain-containing protein [Heyndrickxia sp. MSNUG]|uniref:DUF1450 domain-containing protein n=1 Tax=Heyndrickxia sp. MSNUG TaxID=3136677 RepID=UPI003C2D3837
MNMIQRLFSKQNKLKIELCQKNIQQFLKEEDIEEYQKFFSQKNITLQEYECQSRCKECRISPYAIVNGEMIKAENSAELLDKMKQQI